jgi:two-component system LytT family response regulator
MKLDCYLIDDELHAVDLLRSFINQTPGLVLAGQATRPLLALDEIRQLRPAVTFVDVDMPELSGLDLAGLINSFTKVVFTTSFREFGPEAFERDAVDYLLKPITYPRFLQCIEKLRRLAPAAEPAYFLVKTGTKGVLQKIMTADINYISGLAAYVEIHLTVGKIVTYLSFSELLEQLPPARFSRIHKSFIVNHDYITAIDGGQVRLKGGQSLNIGRTYQAAFFEKLGSALLISRRP